MKRILKGFYLALALACLGAVGAMAQVQIGATSYTTLKAAFDAINAGTHTGAIAIQITGNTTETATASLSKSGTGSASYTSVTIYPTGSYTITGSTSGTDGVIRLSSAQNVTIDGRVNQTGTVNGLTLTATVAAPVIWLDSLTGSTGPKNITVRNCNINGFSSTSSSVFGLVASSSASKTTGLGGLVNVQFLNNAVKKCYYGTRFYGLSASRIYGLVVNGNTFGGDLAADAVQYYGIYIYYSTGTIVNNNIIKNVSSTSGSFYGIYCYYGETVAITNNKVDNINVGSSCYATYFSSSNNTLIKNNMFSNLRSNSTSGYGAFGVYVSSGDADTIVNNVIYNLTSTNYSATSTTYNPFGIFLSSGNNHKIYHNSINMYGTQSGTNSSGTLSGAIYIGSNTGLDIRNNIFVNGLEGLTGSNSYALYFNSTLPTGITLNNNCYYGYGTYGKLACLSGYSGTQFTDIAAWRTSTSQDANSISANPMFNNNTDLRLLPASPAVSGGATIAGFSLDMLGVTRPASPAMGAYQTAGEYAPPVITYTALPKTLSTINRSFDVTITDYSGVNTTTNKPRVYFKKSTNANVYNDNTSATDGWKYTEATNSGNTYTFTIDYSKLNGGAPVAGMAVEYFVVAEDIAPIANVAVNGATLANTPASVALTSASFPAVILNSYNIAYPVSGIINVGAGQTFTNFTGENGLFKYINNNVVNGNTIVKVTSDLVEESYYSLIPTVEEGVGGYTITIQPASATNYTISANVNQAVLRLVGADRVIIDGRFNGEGKYLTFKNDYVGVSIGIMVTSLGAGQGATNNTIRNCKFIGGTTALATWGIALNGSVSTVDASGVDNDNNSIIDNEFTKLYFGIGCYGSAGSMDNLVITGNQLGSATDLQSIGMKAIVVTDCNNTLIDKNRIINVTYDPAGSASNLAGIDLASGTITNTTVSNNIINGVHQPSSGGWGAYGINVGTSTITNTNIYNNVITDITTRNYSSGNSYNAFGIRLTGGATFNIMHNTVNMAGITPDQGTTVPMSAAICITSSSITGLTLQNNIIINQTTFSLSGGKSYAIYMPSGTTLTSSNNLFYVGGANGVLGYNGSDITTFAALQTALTDVTSVHKLPVFTNTNDNNIQYPSTNDAELLAPVLATVPTDIHGETRTAVNNLKGVDIVVFNSIGLSKNLAATADECGYVSSENPYSLNVIPYVSGFADGIARNFPAGDATGYEYTWYHNGSEILGTNTDYTIDRNTLTYNSLESENVGGYYCKVDLSDKTVNSNTLLLNTIVPLEVLNKTNEYLGCMNMTDFTLTANATGTITGYQWFKKLGNSESWTIMPDETTNVVVVPVTTYENVVGEYKCEVYAPVSVCGDAMQAAVFNVNMDLNLTGVEFTATDENDQPLDNMNLCEDAYLKFTATPTGYAVAYKWQVNRNNVWVDLPLVEYPTANTNTLSIEKSRAEHTGNYRVIVYGSPICNQNFTAEYEIQVFELFSIKNAPESATLCEGGTISMGVVGNGEIISYQWTFDGEPIDAIANPTASTPFLEIPKANYLMSGAYACNLQVRDCRGITSTTSPAGYAYVLRATEITSEPVSTYAKLGDKVVYTVGAHHKGKIPPTYKDKFQWFRYTLHNNTVTMLTDNGRFNGTNSSVMSISDITAEDYTTNGDYFFVVVEGICGNDTSKAVTLDLPPVIAIDIKTQPNGAAVCENGNVEFDVVAETAQGHTLTYQWYFNGALLSDGTDVAGATTAKLQLTNVSSDDAGIYTVTVDVVGGGSAINSQAADLTVKTKPTIITDLTDVTVVTDKELKLIVAADGTAPLTYTWTKDGVAINTTATNEYVIAAAADTDAGTYQVTITNECGEVKSASAVVTVTKKVVLGIEEGTISNVAVTPNPAQETATITFNANNAGEATVVIMDVLGNEVARVYEGTINAGMNRATINVAQSNLASGTYYAVISSVNGKQAVQFVVVR